MKVLFMGTPPFAAASLSRLLEAGHDVRAVVTRPDAATGRGLRVHAPAVKRLALDRGIPILQPRTMKDPDLLRRVAAPGAEVIVVVAFGRILPEALLALPPRGAINVHASLLPRWRGASPVAWAIAEGDRETGVTTMRMIRELDAGDILMQRATPIAEEETAGELEARLALLGGELLVQTLDGLAAGTLVPLPQDAKSATWAPALGKEDGVIDWRRPASEIARRVRAFDPWPGARTSAPGPPARWIRILRAATAPAGATSEGAPGTVIGLQPPAGAQERGVLVACGGGTLLVVKEIQPENRRRMPARAGMAGRLLSRGDRLGGE